MIGILTLGLLLWSFAHFLKRLAPGIRAQMGGAGRAIVTALIVAGLVLMIVGYRGAAFIPIWQPPSFFMHINNLLMLVAVFVFASSHTKGRLRGWTRHPMLISVKIWAIAHLLVNGDLASILLFGGLLAWAVLSVILINRAVPDWKRPAPGNAKRDIIFVAASLGVFALICAVHIWLGVWPFPT